MKLLLLVAAFVFVTSAMPHTEWEQYKIKYQKVYTSKEEDSLRYHQYLKTKKKVEEHNKKFEKGESSYWMGINHFSDRFPEEINRMLGSKLIRSSPPEEPFQLPEDTPVPDSINWVTKGAVTSIKDQGFCSSSFAFSVAGSLEALMFTTNKTITDLSAQELLDCGDGDGCYGGFAGDCYDYVMRRNGIDSNATYPYRGINQLCRAARGVIATTCTGYKVLIGEMQMTVGVGTACPVVFAFPATKDFVNYKGGVYDGKCGEEYNHVMLAVGYDKDKETGKDYWLIKNSWGVDWGEKGYGRIIRNKNMCYMTDMTLYPVYIP